MNSAQNALQRGMLYEIQSENKRCHGFHSFTRFFLLCIKFSETFNIYGRNSIFDNQLNRKSRPWCGGPIEKRWMEKWLIILSLTKYYKFSIDKGGKGQRNSFADDKKTDAMCPTHSIHDDGMLRFDCSRLLPSTEKETKKGDQKKTTSNPNGIIQTFITYANMNRASPQRRYSFHVCGFSLNFISREFFSCCMLLGRGIGEAGEDPLRLPTHFVRP